MPRGDKPTTTALALQDGWIYEDALPATISKEQYDRWYRESLVLDGVRMGPPLPPPTDDQLQGETLEPCPFCGVTPTRRDHVYRFGSIAEHPEGSYCPIANATIGIRSWNTRRAAVAGPRWQVDHAKNPNAFCLACSQHPCKLLATAPPESTRVAGEQERALDAIQQYANQLLNPANPMATATGVQMIGHEILNRVNLLRSHFAAAPAGNDADEARRLLMECCNTIERLSDQQAMPDNFYESTLQAVRRFLESTTTKGDR